MIERVRKQLARLAGDDSGFSLIEVLVAAVILAIAVVGIALFLSGGEDSSSSTQLQAEAINLADQQIEQIRAKVQTYGFGSLAMSASPVADSSAPSAIASNIPSDPNSYVVKNATGCGSSSTGLAIAGNYDNNAATALSGVDQWTGCGTSDGDAVEPLEILSSGGFVAPQQTTVAVGAGSETATIDTYVTDTYVGCDSTGSSTTCPTISVSSPTTVSACTWPTATTASTPCADARRVVVAVILNAHGDGTSGPYAPIYVSTVFTNPDPSTTDQGSVGLTVGVTL